MKQQIEVKGRLVEFECEDFNGTIDTDRAIELDYSNLEGDYAATVLAMNRLGALKAEAENETREAELATKIYLGKFQEQVRLNQSKNGGFYIYNNADGEEIKVKYSEKFLEKAHYSDKEWQEKMNDLFKAQRAEGILGSFYWKLNGKLAKLSMYLKGVTPEDFADGLLEKNVNRLGGLGRE